MRRIICNNERTPAKFFKKIGRSLVLYGASDDIMDELKKTVLLLGTGDWEKGIKKF